MSGYDELALVLFSYVVDDTFSYEYVDFSIATSHRSKFYREKWTFDGFLSFIPVIVAWTLFGAPIFKNYRYQKKYLFYQGLNWVILSLELVILMYWSHFANLVLFLPNLTLRVIFDRRITMKRAYIKEDPIFKRETQKVRYKISAIPIVLISLLCMVFVFAIPFKPPGDFRIWFLIWVIGSMIYLGLLYPKHKKKLEIYENRHNSV